MDFFMVVSMTIQNADNVLLYAIKSVCKLHPSAKISIKKAEFSCRWIKGWAGWSPYRRQTAYSSNTKIAKAILQNFRKCFDFDKSILKESKWILE